MRELNLPLEDLKDKYLNRIFADLKRLRHHETPLKNTKENYNKEEKQEEDNLINFY